MLLSQLLKGIVVISEEQDREILDIRTNSQDDLVGCAYVCLRGSKADGHEFAEKAVAQGAAAVIAERETGMMEQILVPDTREAYAVMCANYFGNPAKQIRLAAVTGTNGKTSTATAVKRILCSAGISAGLISTIQAEYGDCVVPLENTTPDAYILHGLLRRMADSGITVAVMEASSHALDQKRLYGLHFSAAVFTNLTQDHLDYHKTMEDYYQAKKKLFSMAEYAVINQDDPAGKRLMQEIPCSYGGYSIREEEAEFFADSISCQEDRVSFLFCYKQTKIRATFPIPGEYSVYNALAAIAVCLHLGLSADRTMRGLASVGVIRGRSEIIETGRNFRVICDYAHTPDGLENILSGTRKYATGRLTLLFGCGGDRDREKRPLMGAAAARLADFLIVTSDNPRTENPAAIIADILRGIPEGTEYIVIVERREAIRYALATARPGDTVILAGKGHEEYQILGDKKVYFDERRLVKGILRTL